MPSPPIEVPALYIAGGRQRSTSHFTDEWHHYREAVVLRVEPGGEGVSVALRYESPAEACPENQPSFVFKAGCKVGRRLYLCTQTEVMAYRLPGAEAAPREPWQRELYLSLPCFNDLHHVVPGTAPDGTERLRVAVTGLDMVAEVSACGELLGTRGALPGQDPWERFDRATDYRRVATTKPHQSHPNYVFHAGGQLWVTRFEQRDAISLDDPSQRLAIDVERPHDGAVRGERVFHTTVDGRVVISRIAASKEDAQAPSKASVERIVDLNALGDGRHALGWCRGILPLDERRVLVGFSRLRPSRLRENLRWVKHRFGQRATAGDRPTRIALYDLETPALLWELSLEEHGLNALFSIHADGIDDVPAVRQDTR